ncbi:MAG TPA: DNA mismatch repair endonuclease MutL [Thermoplasmata archaeon]|nr:DNA mismatch repair endonuclease MutL [Thermoplasmata archaeon]
MIGAASVRVPIRRLSPATVERIAAGEIVERPASVVKELVENSIDAGASTVVVRLDGAGLTALEVEDDGSGIPSEELPLALERHATSKLPPEGPIERIAALGFRGEALASIAGVARLRLTSRVAGEDAAEGIAVSGGGPPERFAVGRAPGTTVEVRDLFFNTPARRKFLKRAAAEQLEVVRTLERLYLAHPSVSLRLEAEGRPIATWPAARSLEDAAAHVLGPAVLRATIPVRAAVPGGSVTGVVGRPSTAVAHSTGLYLAVNGRSIQSRAVTQSVRAAYGDLIPRGRFPVGVLALELADDRVDVNVHPTKREVRFAGERELLDALRHVVRAALVAAPPIAEAGSLSIGPPGPSARGPAIARSVGAIPSGLGARQQRFDVAPASSRGEPPPAPGGRSRLSLLGCLDRLYWIAESEGGFVLVDQHAASERLFYEALLRDGRIARQELVAPVALETTAAQRATIASEPDAIAASGFDVEAFGPTTVRVRAVPSFRGSRASPEAFLRLLDELANGGRPGTGTDLRERRAATIACHAAIRAGDPVEADTLARVIAALEGSPGAAYSCPHGRPIFVELSRRRLDRWFLRAGA